MPKSRKYGAIPLLPHISSWYSAWLIKAQGQLHLFTNSECESRTLQQSSTAPQYSYRNWGENRPWGLYSELRSHNHGAEKSQNSQSHKKTFEKSVFLKFKVISQRIVVKTLLRDYKASYPRTTHCFFIFLTTSGSLLSESTRLLLFNSKLPQTSSPLASKVRVGPYTNRMKSTQHIIMRHYTVCSNFVVNYLCREFGRYSWSVLMALEDPWIAFVSPGSSRHDRIITQEGATPL
jgi:hypothetical protein